MPGYQFLQFKCIHSSRHASSQQAVKMSDNKNLLK